MAVPLQRHSQPTDLPFRPDVKLPHEATNNTHSQDATDTLFWLIGSPKLSPVTTQPAMATLPSATAGDHIRELEGFHCSLEWLFSVFALVFFFFCLCKWLHHFIKCGARFLCLQIMRSFPTYWKQHNSSRALKIKKQQLIPTWTATYLGGLCDEFWKMNDSTKYDLATNTHTTSSPYGERNGSHRVEQTGGHQRKPSRSPEVERHF